MKLLIVFSFFFILFCSCEEKQSHIFSDFKNESKLDYYTELTTNVVCPSHLVCADNVLFFKDKVEDNKLLHGINLTTYENVSLLEQGDGPYETTNLLDLSFVNDTTLLAYLDLEIVHLYDITDLNKKPEIRKLPTGQYAYNSALKIDDDKLLFIGTDKNHPNNRYCIMDEQDSIISFGEYPEDDTNLKSFPDQGNSRIIAYQGKGILNKKQNRACFIFTFGLGFEIIDLLNRRVEFSKFYQYPQNHTRYIEELNIHKVERDLESLRGFLDLCANDERIFFLYSNKKFNEDYESARHILSYNWNGNPLVHYTLPVDVTSISLSSDGNYIYASTAEDNARIIKIQVK